jgi:predicted PurR-regulated permease PerM
LGIETPEKLYESISDIERHLRSLSFNVVREALGFISTAFTSTIAFILAVVNYFVIPVYLIYLLLDFPKVGPAVAELVPPAYRGTFRDRLDEIDGVLSAFVRGQLSVCAILAVLYSIGLYFIGIDLAFAIGVFSGVTFIVPYLGTILGILLSVLMAGLKFHDLLHPLLCLGWILLVQAAEGWIITPNLVGNRVGINPVMALLALLLFGQLFGLLGMLIAVPVVAVLKILGKMVLEMYRDSSFYRENV